MLKRTLGKIDDDNGITKIDIREIAQIFLRILPLTSAASPQVV